MTCDLPKAEGEKVMGRVRYGGNGAGGEYYYRESGGGEYDSLWTVEEGKAR